MRGAHKTRPLESIVEEAKFLARKGVKELILIGQDTTYYGIDLYGERRLAGLLKALGEVNGLEWIRLMYAYPSGFPLEVLDAMRETPSVCRYIDLPLQHASDRVLKSMRRGITLDGTQRLLEAIREKIPSMAIRTTFIVGYPEETDKDFQLLYDFVRQTKFHRLGVFPYSSEDGTAAKHLGDPVPEAVKQERMGTLMELQRQISQERNEGLVGRTVRVLIDRKEGSHAVGRTEWDAPEIDQEVYVQDNDSLEIGNFCTAEIVDAVEYDLYAQATAAVPQ
jgi:ribosomal protein S12 methylthiotransferase